MSDTRSAEIAHRRAQFVELLSASIPQDQERRALHLRINAKVAHARLLSTARFSQDTARATWAMRRARAEIDYCSGFLLES